MSLLRPGVIKQHKPNQTIDIILIRIYYGNIVVLNFSDMKPWKWQKVAGNGLNMFID